MTAGAIALAWSVLAQSWVTQSWVTQSPWVWAAGGALLGAVAAALWPRRERRPLRALWHALGKTPEDHLQQGDDPWLTVVCHVQQQHEAAQRGNQLQLRSVAAEQRLLLTETVLAGLQDGIVVLDQAERVLYANRTARTVLQLGDDEHVALAAASRSEIVDGMRSVLAADLARSVKTCRVEWHADERRLVYLIRAAATAPPPIADGPVAAGPVAVPLQPQVVVLEDWTAEERASRAKSEFIYGVSHELKTPLTAIQASLELANESAALPAEDRDQLIRVAYEESVRLSQMVAELLDLARVEAGITEFKREPVDMRELLQSLLALHQPLAERKQVALKWDVSDYLADLTGDTRLLRQAFVNIVGNAVKYTKAGGEVTLTARLEGTDLVTRVRDTGIGIAAEDQTRVFEKFFRAKSAEQAAIAGTGLGLPMARYIVERHRGRIEMSSELDVGTEFRVYLPAVSADPDDESGSSLVAVDAATE